MIITSLENEKIKNVRKLKEKKYRDLSQEFLVEGEHLVLEAYRSGLLKEIFIEEEKSLDIEVPTTYVKKEILASLSSLDTPSYVMGRCEKKEESTSYGNKILLLDKIQDPGNLGTMIRSSKAFGIDTLVLGEGSVDLYNDKVIRSTQGIGFTMNIITRNLKEFILELKEKEIPVYGTKLENAKDIRNLDNQEKEKFALVMGNEGNGVSPEVLALCDHYIYIPMEEEAESLNVAIATSILLYEYSRRD